MNKIHQNCDYYTDIHSHVLPGVDDGARDMDMSMEMLRHAYEQGIRRMIVTPHHKPMHHNVNREKMQGLIAALQAQMQKENVEIELYTGNELYYREGLVECLEKGEAVTLADSRYALIEFLPQDRWEYIRDGVNTMLMAGYRPVIAHVERYREVCRDMERVSRLREMGGYLQVNAASIMGRYGIGMKHTTRKLLKYRLVDFLATDAHNATTRTTDMAKCAAYIGKKYGEEYLRALVEENPSCIIRDDYI
ncbi:MAG: hypothetical protein PUF03_11970 [Lachnospiraceae bacterium]|nr:hypothetical protein [Lachnospiraceae bacterium]